MGIPTSLGYAGSLVSSWIFLIAEEDLAEVAEAVAERAGAEVTEILEFEFDRTGVGIAWPDF